MYIAANSGRRLTLSFPERPHFDDGAGRLRPLGATFASSPHSRLGPRHGSGDPLIKASRPRETAMKKSGSQTSKSPSQLIDASIKELGDWRGETLSRVRTLVKEADPEVVEEWKW